MSQPTSLFNPVANRSRTWRAAGLAAVVLIPLAFAGLFVSALPTADEALDTIPAAVVNDDTLITQTAEDGTETPVYAGRQLVTELTGDEATGFDWIITNEKDAEAALKAGEVYAILTVPSDFSKSILSIQGDDPVKADISIRVDDSHSYLTSLIAQTVGSSMSSAFGNEITEQYIAGLNSGLSELGGSLGDASDGAGQLADGAGELGDGLGELSDGIDSAADGAHQYAAGVSKYTGGVDKIADGLSEVAAGTTALPQLTTGITNYTDGVSQLSAQIAQTSAALQANPTDPVLLGTLAYLSGLLEEAADGGAAISQGAAGLPALSSGLTQLSNGADELSDGSSALRSGATGLATGLDTIGTGASASADGAGGLADGAQELADGLAKGADLVPAMSEAESQKVAEVASDPVTFTLDTDNPVTKIGQVVATLLVPLGLWIGALAVFLVLRPVTRRSLASTAGDRRLVFASLSRAAIVTGAQALLLVALLHFALDVSWSLLPATLLFSLLTAFAFTAFHYLLTIGLGRAGLVVSLFVLAIQVTSTGGLYPIELLAGPFQAISPFLPLTYGVSGMQAILSGASLSSALTAVVALIAFGGLSTLLALLAIRRTRRAGALGFVPATA